MQFIFTIVCLVVTGLALAFVKSLDLNAGLTMALAIPVVIIAVYGLARIRFEAPQADKQSKA